MMRLGYDFHKFSSNPVLHVLSGYAFVLFGLPFLVSALRHWLCRLSYE